jgi:nucleotide-binding universal stress UspA family protein
VLKIKNILYPTDFSKCAAQAQAHALFLAKRFQCRLHIVHAIVLHRDDPHNPAHHFPDPEELYEKLKNMASDRMDNDLKASHESADEVDIVMKELRGISATDLILEYADANDIDLIVMGTHGRRGLGYMLLGSIAQEVVREAACPVYTIRESEPAPKTGKIRRILAPMDFSDHSKTAVSIAREAAALYNAKLQLLHVVESVVPPSIYGFEVEPNIRLQQDAFDRSEEEMKRIFSGSPGPDVPAEFNIATGHVVNEILECARSKNVDLIVIATHGLSGFKHLLLGSVAEKVIRMAPCPVLTLKAFGKSLI